MLYPSLVASGESDLTLSEMQCPKWRLWSRREVARPRLDFVRERSRRKWERENGTLMGISSSMVCMRIQFGRERKRHWNDFSWRI